MLNFYSAKNDSKITFINAEKEYLIKMKKIDISIIIPEYNEIEHLEQNLLEIEDVLKNSKYSFEIILVDDGSKDGTRKLDKKLARRDYKISYILHKHNLGRGRAVSDGIKKAKGKIVGFIDIDLQTPAMYIPELIRQVNSGYDVVTGWRIYKLSLNPHVILRWITSKGYSNLERFVLNNNLKDTETGCKFFNKKRILPILDEIEDERWFWDTEIMMRSSLAGLSIKEVPTLFIRKPHFSSSVSLMKDTWDYFTKLMKFRKVVRKIRLAKGMDI